MRYVRKNLPMVVVNENVDLSDEDPSSQSNENIVCDHYRKLGYETMVLKLTASDYMLPESRLRSFFISVRDGGADTAFGTSEMLSIIRRQVLKSTVPFLPVQRFLLDEGHHLLLDVLGKLQSLATAASGGGGGGRHWVDAHADSAAKRGLRWPFAASPELRASPWFAVLREREKDLAAWAETIELGPAVDLSPTQGWGDAAMPDDMAWGACAFAISQPRTVWGQLGMLTPQV